MPLTRCPVCGHEGDDFRRGPDGRPVCPACGEAFGRAGPPPVRDVTGRTMPAAAAVLGVGVLALLFSVVWLAALAVMPMPPPPANLAPEQRQSYMIGFWTAQLAGPVVGLAFGSLQVAGGIAFLRHRLWGLAVTGAILGMLPCGCAAVAGFPVGIWALVVLFDPDVKAAFR